MPRQARIQSPTDYYHAMMRGNNREKIFVNKSQKEYFLDCLRGQYEEGLIDIAAYCIMDNHVHIVAKADIVDLSKAIKKLNIKYASRFNNHYDRIGHVFQDRYKSEVVGNELYLLNVIRYVHNNPVKAKMVDESGNYKWSSYRDYIKTNTIVSNNQKEFVLGCYNNVGRFIEFHNEKDDNEYLDTKEDIEEYRMGKAQEIIMTYLDECGMNGLDELKRDLISLTGIINKLLNKSKLSHRQIAKLLDIGNNVVHRISLEDR